MKKLLFILAAIFSVLAFKPTAEGAGLPVCDDNAVEGYILNTTDEEMNVISSNRSLLPPAVRTTSVLSLVNNAGKNITNYHCKHLQQKYNETTSNVIHKGRVNVVCSHVPCFIVVGYYIFSLRRIRV